VLVQSIKAYLSLSLTAAFNWRITSPVASRARSGPARLGACKHGATAVFQHCPDICEIEADQPLRCDEIGDGTNGIGDQVRCHSGYHARPRLRRNRCTRSTASCLAL
jgi:hypothetical protein